MAPIFSPRGIAQFYDVIVADALDFAARWERLAAAGQLVDMIDEMMFLTASIILRAMFGTDVDARILAIKDDVETMIQFVAKREMIPIHSPLWLPTAAKRGYVTARDRVHAFINEVIARRRALPEAPSFLWYALDQNPEVAGKLHEELDAVLDEGAPTEAQLKQLPYTLP